MLNGEVALHQCVSISIKNFLKQQHKLHKMHHFKTDYVSHEKTKVGGIIM